MSYTIPAQTFNGLTLVEPLVYGKNVIWKVGGDYFKTDEDVYVLIARTSSSGYFIIQATEYSGKRDYWSPDGVHWYEDNPFSLSWTYEGKTVYNRIYEPNDQTVTILQPDDVTIGDLRGSSNTGVTIVAKLAWLMIYGGYIVYNITYDLENCAGESSNPTFIIPYAPVTIANFIPDETDDAAYTFNSGSCWIDGEGAEEGVPILFIFDPDTGNLRIGLVSTDIVIHVHAFGDPYQKIDGESDIPGGDTIQVPGSPSVTATSSGFVGLFAPTSAQMKLLADYMWTDFGGTGTTEVDVLKEIVQALKRSICNPLDYVIGLSIIPSQGLSIGSNQEIRFGFTNSGISFPRLTSQFFTVDCGSLSFDTLCDDTFLDYAPYSKFSIYLPYIGFRVVDANDFVGHTIGVIYHGDVVTGGLTAFILKDGSVMYQYSGSCSLNVPLRADAWSSTIASAISLARSIPPAPTPGGSTSGGGGSTSDGGGSTSGGGGSRVATVQNGLHAASNLAFNPSLIAPQVMRSGAISGGAGQLGVQKPYVVREAVRFHSTKGMNTLAGYPSYYFMPLSSMHGYTVVEEVHIHGITATAEEISEIESLLKGGVIF